MHLIDVDKILSDNTFFFNSSTSHQTLEYSLPWSTCFLLLNRTLHRKFSSTNTVVGRHDTFKFCNHSTLLANWCSLTPPVLSQFIIAHPVQCSIKAHCPQTTMRATKTLTLAGSLLFLMSRGTSAQGESVGFLIHNHYGQDIYISGDWAAKDCERYGEVGLPKQDHVLQNDSSVFLEALPDTSPKYFIGLTPNHHDVGEKRDRDTVIEATFVNQDGDTYYDVDVEKGVSVPIWCHGQAEQWDTGRGCEGDVLSDCPEHLKHYDHETGTMDQCVGEGSPADLERRRKHCSRAYILSDDHVRGVNKVHDTAGNERHSD